jgi:hypothetical protein
MKGFAGLPASPVVALSGTFRSLIRSSTAKNEGTNSMARSVEASMPLNTAMPMDWRAAALAPTAITRGKTPRMKTAWEPTPLGG